MLTTCSVALRMQILNLVAASISTKTGTVTKSVTCENCRHQYDYVMQRTGVSTRHDGKLSKAEADEQTTREAEEKLATALATDCDVKPCPKCGAMTAEMRAKRRKFLPQMLMVTGGGLGLLALVAGAWWLTGKIYIFAAAVGGLIALAGIVVILVEGTRLLLIGRPKQSS